MTQITPKLFLGNAVDAQSLEFLSNKHIALIVNCAKELPNFYDGKFRYIRLNLDDNLQQDLSSVLPVIHEIIRSMMTGQPVFVHCAAGVSRIAIIVIFTIMNLLNWSFF